ncbi:MAG: DNA mismatch repair endonuclease MutL [Planctomycetota bacterium]|jgi:DNA mismatch repair protein MutL
MGRIVNLDQNTVNMIAAGEVIERPASVVKELVENSIDAGATRLNISIEDGGRKSITIVDDGCGLDAEDLAAAFEPHATSKLKNASDLRHISTLGFRGEALASIASVAQVKAVSRMQDCMQGHCLEIDCGSKKDIQPCSADYGTKIEIRDLFYKMPARRKFLKTANTEMGHITEQFIRTALANRNLDMTLQHNSKEIYNLSSGQGFHQRIAELFSRQIAENLFETESDEKGVRIYALLGRPEISRANNKLQHVFINGRFIRDKFISHAIKEAYRGHLEPGRFPVVFLFIEMSFEDYDVNVHPTKIEVRFFNANLVHSQILGVLREKLLSTNLDTQIQLSTGIKTQTQSEAGSERSQQITEAINEFFKKHKPIHTQNRFDFQPSKTSKPVRPEEAAKYKPVSSIRVTNVDPGTNLNRKYIQIHDSFIVAQTEDGFIIVDQHALHERILYEQLKKRINKSNLESQKLLIPESFEISDMDSRLMDKNTEVLKKLGIEIVPFGPKTYAVQAFPSILSNASPVDFMQDLIDLFEGTGFKPDPQQMLDDVLNLAACKGAIKAGQKLTEKEIEQLLSDKESIEQASRCPHGRPSVIKFTVTELERQFKRT